MPPAKRVLLLACLLPMVGGCQVVEFFRGNTPERAMTKAHDPDFADRRRQGINDLMRLGNFARKPPYTTRYAEIAQTDADFTVRAVAIRALNQSRDRSATKIFIAALSDSSDLVRLEAAKALNRVPDSDSIDPLRKLMLDPEEKRDVRIAAAEALRHYRNLDSARSLIALLNEKDFSLAWQARQTLTAMTGVDKGYNESAWLNHVTGPGKL